LISDDGGGSPQAVTLAGGGTPGPAARLSTSAVVFGEQAVGTTSSAETVVLTNQGSAQLAIGSMTVAGATGRDFVQTNTCGSSLAAGASCTIEIRFTPRAIGTRTAVINVNVLSNHQSGSLQLKVQGTGSIGKRRQIRENDQKKVGTTMWWKSSCESFGRVGADAATAHTMASHNAARASGCKSS